MIRHKHIDRLCALAMLLALGLAGLFAAAGALGLIRPASAVTEYAGRLFDTSYVHTVDLQVEDWPGFLASAPGEEYISCTAVIDGEAFYQVGLRAKGNNSLRLTEEYGLSRYSLKLEFDHYQDGGNYYGLDKLSLDASFQDNSYLKSYPGLRYDGLHGGAHSPVQLCVGDGERPALGVVPGHRGAGGGLCPAKLRRTVTGSSTNPTTAPWRMKTPTWRCGMWTAIRPATPTSSATPSLTQMRPNQARLIEALRVLDSEENLETAVDVDEVLRYFAVQVFVMNWDSYLGHTGHNYFLYEEDGVLSILPWDYNLAFGTYALGMTDPIRDPERLDQPAHQHPRRRGDHAEAPSLPQSDAEQRLLRPVSRLLGPAADGVF